MRTVQKTGKYSVIRLEPSLRKPLTGCSRSRFLMRDKGLRLERQTGGFGRGIWNDIAFVGKTAAAYNQLLGVNE